MEILYDRCAGLDVHKKMVSACRLLTLEAGSEQRELRSFGTTPHELHALRDWLREGGCTHVAIVSNGSYWKPVYNLLEGEAELLLTDLRPWKHVPARRAGVKNAEWAAELLRFGLLRDIFVPPRPQHELRDLRRERSDLID